MAGAGGGQGGDGWQRALRLRADPQRRHAQLHQRLGLIEQIQHRAGLGLHAVQGEKLAVFLGAHGQAIGMFNAAKSAVVLAQVKVPSGKAARRKRQRHPPPHHHLAGQAGRGFRQQGGQFVAIELQRGDKAAGAQAGQPAQGVAVVGVQMRAGHKRPAATGADGAQVAGFHQPVVLSGQLVGELNRRARFHQRWRGQHHLLAGGAQLGGDVQPVGRAHHMAAQAHGFAQIHHVHRAGGHLAVKRLHGVPGPVVQQRAEGDEKRRGHFHGRSNAPCVVWLPSAWRASVCCQSG